MARSLEIAKQMAAPNQPGPVTIVMGSGLRSNPNVHRAPSGSLRVRIEAGWEWWSASKTLRNAWLRSADQLTSGNDRSRWKPNPL